MSPPPPPPVPAPDAHPLYPNARLSLPLPLRLLITTTPSFLLGATLGSYSGGHRAALQFRAENAHRQPRSQKGWYFYHKTKNYRTMWGGIRGGGAMGARIAGWVAVFVVFEDAVDRLRGNVDAAASVVAGLGTAGVFTVVNGIGWEGAVRTAKRGLLVGVVYGLLQDLVRRGKGGEGGFFAKRRTVEG